MCQFIESIKIEFQRPYLLEIHQNRLNKTLKHFGSDAEINLDWLYTELNHDENGLFKWRVLYDLDGNYEMELIPYLHTKIADFEIVINNDLDYNFKYENRSILQELKTKATAKEIIIVKNNEITDTSFSNLIFLKDKTWYTPKSYLLNGVQRQYLLKIKKIKETEITLKNINEFSHFQLINSMKNLNDMFIYPIEKIINLPKPNTGMAF